MSNQYPKWIISPELLYSKSFNVNRFFTCVRFPTLKAKDSDMSYTTTFLPSVPDTRMLYHYRCQVLHVVDGDTLDLLIDWGRKQYTQERVRLNRINAPEISKAKTNDERVRGLEAKEFLSKIVYDHQIRPPVPDEDGRWNDQYEGVMLNKVAFNWLIKTSVDKSGDDKMDSFGRLLVDLFRLKSDGAARRLDGDTVWVVAEFKDYPNIWPTVNDYMVSTGHAEYKSY